MTCIRLSNMINAVTLCVSAVISFTLLSECTGGCSSFSISILAFYTLFFSILLFVFELRMNTKSEGVIRQNCGFMFSNRGKAILLFFLASMTYSCIDSGLGGLWWFSILAGTITTLNAIFLCLVICKHPSFDEYSRQHNDQMSPQTSAAPVSNYDQGTSSMTTSFNEQPSSTPFGGENPFSSI